MEKLPNRITGDNLHLHNNELENIQNNPFGIKQPLLTDTCVAHKGARLDYLSVDSAQNFVFKCMYCVTDDNSNQLALVPIEQILIADSKTVFANFPLKDRDLTREIKQIAQNPPTGSLIKQSIDTFFKEFRAKLLNRIDSIQQKMVEKAQSISDFGEVLMSNYNRVSSKEQIKLIVSDRYKPIEAKSTELKDICAEALSKDEENTQLFTSLINSMKTLEKATDFETPKLISESIFKQLESINMFLVEDISLLQQSLLNTAPQSLQQQGKQSSDLDAVANLMKLVRNKLNDVSSESCEKLEEQLNQYKFIISKLNIPVPGSVFENLNSFNDEETRVFKGLISEVAKEKEGRLSEVGESGQIQREDREMSEKQKLNANQIIDFVKNHTNFCSPEYIEDMSKVMTRMSGLFGLFQVRKPGSKSVERAAFNGLKEKQLEDIVKLATQINLLTQNHSDLYLHSRLPSREIQSNSSQLMKYINNNFYFKSGTVEEKAKVKMDLDQLLVQYPIFELLPPLVYFKFLPINFSRTKFLQSSEMRVNVNGNMVELTFPNCAGRTGQTVSETLNNESGYRIKLKFNKPYGKHGTSGYFRIGLIPDSQIDSTYVLPNSLQSGFCSYPDRGAELVPIGDRLSQEPIRSETNEIEIRWCIQKKQFFISDLSYQNVNQAKEEYFTPTEKYRFGVCFDSIPESDWKVTISDYSEIDPSEVPLL